MYGGMMGMYSPYMWGGMGMYGWGKRASAETTSPIEQLINLNRTECVYIKDNSTLSCIGLIGVVECDVELRFEKNPEDKREFMIYGIAKSETTPRSYRLLPRLMSNTDWLDNTYMFNGVKKQVSLFCSKDLDHFGLRVLDRKCFDKLDELFQMSRRNEKVYVKIEGAVEMPTARIVADLTVVKMVNETEDAEKTEGSNEKRHYGYGGYRYGYGGYRGGYGGHHGHSSHHYGGHHGHHNDNYGGHHGHHSHHYEGHYGGYGRK